MTVTSETVTMDDNKHHLNTQPVVAHPDLLHQVYIRIASVHNVSVGLDSIFVEGHM